MIINDKKYKLSIDVVLPSDHLKALLEGTAFYMPENLTKIGDNKYAGFNESVATIPNSVETIGNYAFYRGRMSSVILPPNLKSIGDYCFYLCESLKSMILPETIEYIGDSCFISTKITEMDFPSSLIYIKNVPPRLTQLDLSKCVKVTELTNSLTCDATIIILPPNIEIIDNGAFNGCKITSIDIPETIKKLGQAFSSCSTLETINLSGCTHLQEVGEKCFYNCSNLNNIDLSDCLELNKIGESSFYNCTSLTNIDLSKNNQLTIIDKNAFNKCTSLSSITLPSSLTTLSEKTSGGGTIGSFYGCSQLETINLNECLNLEIIGTSCFYNCSKLPSLDLSQNTKLKYIGGQAFYNCSSLTEIILPSSIEQIGETYYSAFGGCNNLTTITINKPQDSISGAPWGATNATVIWNG